MDRLFQASDFFPRSHCGAGWTSFLITVNQGANLVIFLAYISIPINLAVLWLRRRSEIPKSRIIILFIHFIFLCGLTHLSDVIAFYRPMYRLFTLLDFLAAFFSGITAAVLPFTIHHLLKLPPFERIRRLNEQLQEEILQRTLSDEECKAHSDRLKAQVRILEAELHDRRWVQGKYLQLEKLKDLLEQDVHGRDLPS